MESPQSRSSAEEDAELVAQAQTGDVKAFDQLVRKYTPKLYGMIYHMTSHREDTHDLLQEAFTKAYRALRKFRGHSSFYTWLYAIALNLTLSFLKKKRRHSKISLDQLDDTWQQDEELVRAATRADPRHEINIHELQQRLNEAMMRLSEDHRTVVTLFDIQGMPHTEISQLLGISQGTVRSRLFYAHQQMQIYLEEFRH